MGKKDGCNDNRILWYVVVLQSFHIFCHFLAGGVLCEILGFVSRYDLERCALLMYFYNFMILKIKDDFYVYYVFVVVPLVLRLHCLVKYHMRLVWLIVFNCLR